MSARFEGWTITAVVSAALAVLALAGLGVLGANEEGYRFIIRWTGRASTMLFALAFSASSAFALWRTPLTTWLRRNRRYVGVSFAASQWIHLMGLAALAGGSSAFRDSVALETMIVGGVAYVFTFVLALTSSDAAVRALGRRWQTLHRVGSWWIFAVLLITVLPAAPQGPLHAFLSAALVGALALRTAARFGMGAKAAA